MAATPYLSLEIPIHAVTAMDMAVTSTLVAATQVLLERHGRPQHLQLAWGAEVPTDIEQFNAFQARHQAGGSYAVNAVLAGADVCGGRRVLSRGSFLVSMSDRQIAPEDVLGLGRLIVNSRTNPAHLLSARGTLNDLGWAAERLVQGRGAWSAAHWDTQNRGAAA